MTIEFKRRPDRTYQIFQAGKASDSWNNDIGLVRHDKASDSWAYYPKEANGYTYPQHPTLRNFPSLEACQDAVREHLE